MICLIKQPAGIGDIFFCQKIADHYISQEYDVIWPVIKEYNYIGEYIKKDKLKFVCVDDDFPFKNEYKNCNDIFQHNQCLILPICNAGLSRKKIMTAKYEMLGIDWADWDKHFVFERNHNRENDLFKYLGLTENEEYIFVNKTYASPPSLLTHNINISSNKRIVELKNIEGITVFDWLKVIENANEIHMVDTCFNYLIEKINLKATVKKLYYRFGNETKFQLDGLFKTKWN